MRIVFFYQTIVVIRTFSATIRGYGNVQNKTLHELHYMFKAYEIKKAQ